jgi:hypothetical protein
MASNVFKDVPLTADQVNSVYPLKQMKLLNDNLLARIPDSTLTGTNIVVGSDNLKTSTDVDVLDGINNAIIIGNGQFQGDHPMQNGAVAIGNNITMPAGTALEGCLIFGTNFRAVGTGVVKVDDGASNASLKIYYKGTVYYLPLFNAVL